MRELKYGPQISTPFGSFIVDERVSPNEVWLYTDGALETITPCGKSILGKPNHKIVNIGRDMRGLGVDGEVVDFQESNGHD